MVTAEDGKRGACLHEMRWLLCSMPRGELQALCISQIEIRPLFSAKQAIPAPPTGRAAAHGCIEVGHDARQHADGEHHPANQQHNSNQTHAARPTICICIDNHAPASNADNVQPPVHACTKAIRCSRTRTRGKGLRPARAGCAAGRGRGQGGGQRRAWVREEAQMMAVSVADSCCGRADVLLVHSHWIGRVRVGWIIRSTPPLCTAAGATCNATEAARLPADCGC